MQSTDFSHKAAGLKPFMAMDILERAQELERKGRSIIHLAVGEPDFPTPKVIKDAAVKVTIRTAWEPLSYAKPSPTTT